MRARFAPHGRRIFSTLILAFAVGLLVSACSSVKPQPLSRDEISTGVSEANVAAFDGSSPVVGLLTLDEAIARAIKNNLDQRVYRMEQALALNIWEAGRFDMLPEALAVAGYTGRNKDLIRNSIDSVTGEPSLANPYISSDRNSILTDLGLSWSTLDLSMGYYNAKQNGDRVLIAAEQRRKAIFNLTNDVTAAYWRMVSAQELMDQLSSTKQMAEQALADSRAVEQSGLNAPIDSLRYQRQILENIRLLANIEKEFASSRVRLANLINIPLSSSFRVEEPDWSANAAVLRVSVSSMEDLALSQNAEIHEQLYRERIANTELKKVMASLFPNLNFNYSLMHSDDSYLINNSWQEAGLQIAQNLTGLLSLPKRRAKGRAEVELVFQRRVALQMAVVAKLHIARLELLATHRQLELADDIWVLDQSIHELSANREQVETASQLNRVATEVAAIVSMSRRYQALAEFNAAIGNLQSTLGVELEVESADRLELSELTEKVSLWRRTWHEQLDSI